MTQRLSHPEQSPELYKKYMEFSAALRHSAIEVGLRDLVNIRVSQINGCAFCVDMHSKEAKIHGERELRLYHIAIWRESPLFSQRERAALNWAEALTTLSPHGVSDADYETARAEFSEKELGDLTFCVIGINGWNRSSIAFRNVPGTADKLYGLDKAGLS